MPRVKNILLFSVLLIIILQSCGQGDKSKRPSPPATASETITNGNTVTIDYSSPSIKGRTIGKEVAPFGKVWRTGANEATTFEIIKDAKIEGKPLPAGKYSLYTIPGEESWTIIINRTWKQSGTEYNEKDDILRVQVTPAKSADFAERMKFVIEKDGRVMLLWGDTAVTFRVE